MFPACATRHAAIVIRYLSGVVLSAAGKHLKAANVDVGPCSKVSFNPRPQSGFSPPTSYTGRKLLLTGRNPELDQAHMGGPTC